MKSTWSLFSYSAVSCSRMGIICWHGTQPCEPSSSSRGRGPISSVVSSEAVDWHSVEQVVVCSAWVSVLQAVSVAVEFGQHGDD